jgi:hypothetical protein
MWLRGTLSAIFLEKPKTEKALISKPFMQSFGEIGRYRVWHDTFSFSGHSPPQDIALPFDLGGRQKTALDKLFPPAKIQVVLLRSTQKHFQFYSYLNP